MIKWQHTYKCNDNDFPFRNYISFKLIVGSKEYGSYEEGFLLQDKFRMLRTLALNKQSLVRAFYDELDHYTRIAKFSPTEENIATVKELVEALSSNHLRKIKD